MIGATLGHFEIQAKIGEGGMGAVYRAKDLKLGRTVAIKVLPPSVTALPERRARFIQEAKAASSLQHPGIVTIHEIGTQDGVDYIVMELVDGKLLGDLIPRQGMAHSEVMRLGVQMADALAKAHAARIIHRDLKPANVMVTADGHSKILDFGLAKLVEAETLAPGDETVTNVRTEGGVIMGTVSYMSPEQAEGRKLDSRSDIFSFGSMLFEMLTGRRAFQRDTPTGTMAAVMRDPVDTTLLPPLFSPVVMRCLEKDPELRFQTMADVRAALLGVEHSAANSAGAAGRHATPRRLHPAWAGGAILLAAGALGFWWWQGEQRPTGRLAPLRVVHLTTDAGFERGPTFSPDGNQVAFTSDGGKREGFHLYAKMVGGPTALQLTTNPAMYPAWSPDGRQIAYLSIRNDGGALYLTSPLGGPERRVGDLAAHGQITWTSDSRFVAAAIEYREVNPPPDAGVIVLTPVDGSGTQALVKPPQGLWYKDPDFHPSRQALAFLSCEGSTMNPRCQIQVADLRRDWSVSGTPRTITARIHQLASPRWTPDGDGLVYSTGDHLWRVDASGSAAAPLRLEAAGSGVDSPASSRRGNRLAYARSISNLDIWRMDGAGVTGALISSTLRDVSGRFSPDGSRIAFVTQRSGENLEIWLARADGSEPTPLTSGPGIVQGSPAWSPDGKRIAFDSQPADAAIRQVWTINSAGGTPKQLTQLPQGASVPSWSQNGESVYFNSNATGQFEIYRMPAAGGGPARQVTSSGGFLAQESPDGQTLYYIKSSGTSPLYAMPVSGGAERKVLEAVAGRGFQVFRDGIYYLAQAGRRFEVRFHQFGTAKDRLIGPVNASVLNVYLSVSPDRNSILLSCSQQSGSDLMLIENFR